MTIELEKPHCFGAFRGDGIEEARECSQCPVCPECLTETSLEEFTGEERRRFPIGGDYKLALLLVGAIIGLSVGLLTRGW